jgi:two-component system sensor histidine kinase BaeS
VLLSNLIGNAVKYTPTGARSMCGWNSRGQQILIAIADTGIGIAPEDQAHVFDKFYRAANDAVQEVTGTGLGLSLAREVARLHGGEIHLESKPDAGSTFTIELPVATLKSAQKVVHDDANPRRGRRSAHSCGS